MGRPARFWSGGPPFGPECSEAIAKRSLAARREAESRPACREADRTDVTDSLRDGPTSVKLPVATRRRRLGYGRGSRLFHAHLPRWSFCASLIISATITI